MIIKKLPIIALIAAVLLGGTNGKPQPPEEPVEEVYEIDRRKAADDATDATTGVPAMYAAHDYASDVMHGRMTIPKGEPCDHEFSNEMEGIVGEMEQNKEASDTLAEKLRVQFKDLVDTNADKKMCEKDLWCDADSDTCKPKETDLKGRAMTGDEGAGAGPGSKPAQGGRQAAEPAGEPKEKKSNGITLSIPLFSVLSYSLISLSQIF